MKVNTNVVVDPNGTLPKYATEGAAGMDLYALEDTFIHRNKVTLVSTGVRMNLPKGTFGDLRLRSGTAIKNGLQLVSSGVIDEDFTGVVKVPLTKIAAGTEDNPNQAFTVIKKGERFAQIIVTPYFQTTLTEVGGLTARERSMEGFGSSGV